MNPSGGLVIEQLLLTRKHRHRHSFNGCIIRETFEICKYQEYENMWDDIPFIDDTTDTSGDCRGSSSTMDELGVEQDFTTTTRRPANRSRLVFFN